MPGDAPSLRHSRTAPIATHTHAHTHTHRTHMQRCGGLARDFKCRLSGSVGGPSSPAPSTHAHRHRPFFRHSATRHSASVSSIFVVGCPSARFRFRWPHSSVRLIWFACRLAKHSHTHTHTHTHAHAPTHTPTPTTSLSFSALQRRVPASSPTQVSVTELFYPVLPVVKLP